MTDEKVLKSWQELHDQILAALLKCGSDRDVEDFENWFEQEPKVTPVPALLHKSGSDRSSPFPGRTYPTETVTGIPSAV